MKIISVINQKGGVAKTVTTSNIACAMTKMGKKVLVVDLDPQGSLSIISGLYGPDGENDMEYEPNTYHVLCKDAAVEDAIVGLDYNLKGELFILPADIELENANLELQGKANPNNLLKKALRQEEIEDFFDYVIIDCPPALNRLSMNALNCSDGVLIPCIPALLAYKALQRLFITIEIIKEDNPDLEIIGLVPKLVEERREKHQKYLKKIHELGVHVFNNIPKRAIAENTSDEGVPVVLAKSGSDIGREYYKIAEHIVEKYEKLK